MFGVFVWCPRRGVSATIHILYVVRNIHPLAFSLRVRNTKAMGEGRDEEIARWQAWLQGQLDERGWRQKDLVAASEGTIKRDRVSKWVTGKELPSYPNAIIVANTLQVPQISALRAASFDVSRDAENVPSDRTRAMHEAAEEIKGRYTDYETRRALYDYSDSDLLNELRRRAEIREAYSAYVAPVTHDRIEERLAHGGISFVGGSVDDDFTAEDFEVSEAPANAYELAAKGGETKSQKLGAADDDDEDADPAR